MEEAGRRGGGGEGGGSVNTGETPGGEGDVAFPGGVGWRRGARGRWKRSKRSDNAQ